MTDKFSEPAVSVERHLASLPPFDGLPDAVRQDLAETARDVVPDGSGRLIAAGTPRRGLWLIVDGRAVEGQGRTEVAAGALAPHTLEPEAVWPEDWSGDADCRLLHIDDAALRRAYLAAPEPFTDHPAHAAACDLQSRLSQTIRDHSPFGRASSGLSMDIETMPPVRAVHGGTQICAAGDPSDFLMIVLTGQIRPSLRNDEGQVLLPSIGPGHTVGELGLILEQPRAASLTAARDSELLVIDRDLFRRLLHRHPEELNRLFCASLHRHLVGGPARHDRPRCLAVLSLSEPGLAREVAEGLRRALQERDTVHLIGGVERLEMDDVSPARFQALERAADLLLLVADDPDEAWRRQCIRQADHLLFVGRPDDSPELGTDETLLSADPGLAMKQRSVVLVHPQTAQRPRGGRRWAEPRKDAMVHHLRLGNPDDAGRVARWVTGRAQGLVLGGGGARGFAHLGVLQELREAGHPIDMVGGNSMGALIGAQFVQGKPLGDILTETRSFARGGDYPTFPLISLFGGHRVRRSLHRMFEGWALEDTWVPFFSVSCDLSTASIRVHRDGAMTDAVLASNSPAGLLPPMVQDGHLLVDGAVLNNVPVDVMRDFVGRGKVIAVDVNLREDLAVEPDVKRLSLFEGLRRLVLRRPRLPFLAEIMVRAGIVGGIAQGDRVRRLADLYIEPEVSDFSLIAYGKAEAIAAAGVRAARERLADWP